MNKFVVAGLIACVSTPALADQWVLRRSNIAETCTITAQYADRTLFDVVANRSGRITMRLSNGNWRNVDGRVTIEFDNTAVVVNNRNDRQIAWTATSTIIDRFARASAMTVTTRTMRATYSLNNSSAGVRQLDHCIDRSQVIEIIDR